MASNAVRILSFDTSLSCPGSSIVEFKNGKPKVIDVSHVKTESKQPLALRSEIVEAWSTLFIAKHVKKGFDVVAKEDFHGMSSAQNYPVFSAWAAIERSVYKHDYEFDRYTYFTDKGKRKTSYGISQSRAKTLVVGKGKAEKHEVDAAVRELTGFSAEFSTNDESDAVCIALAYGIQRGLMPDIHGKLNRYDLEAIKRGDFK